MSLIHTKTPSPSSAASDLPLWAQRLGSSRLLADSPKWPNTPEDGLRQSLALSDLGHRQLIERARIEHPNISLDVVLDLTYQQICAWQRLRSSLRFRRSS